MSVPFGLLLFVLLLLAVPLYSLPATISLPRGQRPGVEPLSLGRAAAQLLEIGASGLALVEVTRTLVSARMAYCRRNSFDSYARAFERGYGYCSQQSRALADLLGRMGFEASVVHAFKTRFPDGSVSSHAWVRVSLEGQSMDVDPIFYDAAQGRMTCAPLSRVHEVPGWLRPLEGWGAPAVNAHRYYLTGKDEDW